MPHRKIKSSEIEEKTDFWHVRHRAEMYMDSIRPVVANLKVYSDEMNKIISQEVEYVPGLNKIINEIIDNSTDAAVRSNYQVGNRIHITINQDTVTIKDNGTGIEVTSKGYIKAFTKLKAGSNFSDDGRITTGLNGVGGGITLYSSVFMKVVSVDMNGNRGIFEYHNLPGGLAREEALNEIVSKEDMAPKSASHGVEVTFKPDLEFFHVTEISDVQKQLIYTRLINLAFTHPKIEFYFNGLLVKARDFHSFLKFYGDNSLALYEDENLKVAVFPSDSYQSIHYANGLNLIDGGTINDYIINNITNRFTERLQKGYKSITNSIVKNKIGFVIILKNMVNLRFTSQSKTKLSNTYTELGLPTLNYNEFTEKLFKFAPIKDPIMDLFKIMMKFEEQKALKDAFKPKKPTEVEGLLTATEENVFLHIVEGDSAKGLANAIGRKDKAFITSGGKLPNLLDAKSSDIAKNKKIKPIIEALGYDFSKKPEEQQLNYEYIVSTVDRDSDGNHIQALLLTFIYRCLPHLIDEGKVLQFITPLFLLRDKNDKVVDFAWSFQDKKDKNLENKPGRLEYVKGLGALSEEIMDDVIKLIGGDINDLYIQLDREGVEEILTWMGKSEKDMTNKKRILSEDIFFSIDSI